MRKYALFPLILLLSACTVGENYARPLFSFPDFWGEQEQKETPIGTSQAQDWWQGFNDPALNALIEEGHKHNGDLIIAVSRVAQARAILGEVDTDFYPDIDLEAGANRVRNSRESRLGSFGVGSKPFNTFTLGAVFNYEVDLWGKIRRASESARAQLMAAEANRDAVKLALSSEIASGYFNLLALDTQIKVTQDTIASREESYRYESAQYERGIVNELTYRRSQSELATARAALPVLHQAKIEQESALAILLGRSPKEIVEEKITPAENMGTLPVPPALPADLPSTLLERRPDIYAAEQQLISANAEIGVAKAAYFPSLSLSSLFGLESSEANRLLQASAREWNLGANIAQPLLDLPRIGYTVERAKAAKEEATANYAQTVRVAFKDVIDAMSAEKISAERTDALFNQVDALSHSLRIASLRYDAGYSTYLEKLDAQRDLYQAQLDLVTARRDRLIASVNLSKALGGGWAVNKNNPKQ